MPSLDLATTTQDTLARMLRRLPASLWDTDPVSETLQRDLYQAIAEQLAVWLQQREVARTMTLLLEAEGIDLDVLLEDYGLRRYLGRPDPYARQVGMTILWTPKGTEYSVERLADLLFDLPHMTLRTGPDQVHVLVADTHPITTPYSYWGLVSDEGIWYAVTVDGGVPTISQRPPPGLNQAPGPHTLRWFTVQDASGDDWYVSIHGDTLTVAQTPPAGYGTAEPFSVLDGQGQVWGLQVDAPSEALVPVLDTGLPGFGFWQLRARDTGIVQGLWIEAGVPTFGTTLPGGATDQTPGGTPLDWCTVLDETGASWYLHIEADTLMVETTPPGGSGTDVEPFLLDVAGTRWHLSVSAGESALVVTEELAFNDDLLVLSPEHPFQALQLLDSASTPWYLSIDTGTLQLTPTLPPGAIDATPAGGPFAWLRLYDLAGTRWYAFPTTWGVLGVQTTSPGGLGTAAPQSLGDAHGTLWHLGVDPAGNVGASDAPHVDYAEAATAVCMTDPLGGRWFWRAHGQVFEWSSTLWPDTIDQSPWGSLGWLLVPNEDGEPRYVWPTPLGDPIATAGPPVASPWGWQEPFTLRALDGAPWHLTVRRDDDQIGIVQDIPDDLPPLAGSLPLREALEAFYHIVPAGCELALLVS